MLVYVISFQIMPIKATHLLHNPLKRGYQDEGEFFRIIELYRNVCKYMRIYCNSYHTSMRDIDLFTSVIFPL